MKIRRFRADFIFAGNETAFAITEHTDKWNAETIAIHSLYDNKRISRRDVSVDIFKIIYYDLAEDETALLQFNLYSNRKQWNAPFRNRLKVQYAGSARGQFYQTRLLSNDAMKRKCDLSEVFDEPIYFSAVQQEREEGENDN